MPIDPIETALAGALTAATAAGQWQLVSDLARQLDDRRRDRERTATAATAEVVAIDSRLGTR